MKILRKTLLALALSASFGTASAAITYIGETSFPGDATDLSGLTEPLSDGTPHNQLGGIGSGIAYLGGNQYVVTPDRGPADGTTEFKDRLDVISISVVPKKNSYAISSKLVRTTLLIHKGSEKGVPFTRYFTGSASAFDSTGSPVTARDRATGSLRFDPEGVRVSQCAKTVFISDEYGPYLYEFNRGTGQFIRTLNLPTKYRIDTPSTTNELTPNLFGRQTNRGMEGLAISPDGSKLFGMMQNALIQDGALDAGNARIGLNNRIVQIDVASGQVEHEYLYPLADKGYGINEIVAINDHEFLVLERDGKVGTKAVAKKLFKIDISGATDIRNVKQLPTATADAMAAGITPVAKTEFLDMLAAIGGATDTTPEKWEGLAFGPDLPDGRHLLIVSIDNDLKSAQPNQFYLFAIDPSDLPGYVPQTLDASLCPK